MEKDRLEKFVLENREEFDIYEPSQDIWNKIQGQQKKPAVIRIIRSKYAGYAAAAALAFFVSFFFQNYNSDNTNNNNISAQRNNVSNENLNIPELAEAEAYYSTLVTSKINEISILTVDNPEVSQELQYDMNELEQIYNDLRSDLADNAGNEEVIEAMIQNYRTRLEILEDLLRRLKNENQKENKDENNSTSI